jgi:hypothetical protein
MLAAFDVWRCGFLFYLGRLYLGMVTATVYAVT